MSGVVARRRQPIKWDCENRLAGAARRKGQLWNFGDYLAGKMGEEFGSLPLSSHSSQKEIKNIRSGFAGKGSHRCGPGRT